MRAEKVIPPEQLERLEAALAALEQVFRPLVKRLTPDIEPAVVFEPGDSE